MPSKKKQPNSIQERIKRLFKLGIPPGTTESDARAARRERIIVFVVAYVLALSLWFIVNLNNDYNITLRIPLEPGMVPQNRALVQELPEYASVEISGEGWNLVSLYNNPPSVRVDVTDGQVNLFDQIRQRFSVEQNVSVLNVQPFRLEIELEERITKRVPVVVDASISFSPRYGLISEPTAEPDSISITGARSRIDTVEKWVVGTDLTFDDVREDIMRVIPVESEDPLVRLSEDEVMFRAEVSEFTEGEVSVYLKTRGLPRGQIINYNPSAILIRYDVPIEKYAEVQKIPLYEAYIPFSEIRNDSTGFVTPNIELLAKGYNLKLRSFQPKAVAYFSVVEQ